jgi:hypothetical protein
LTILALLQLASAAAAVVIGLGMVLAVSYGAFSTEATGSGPLPPGALALPGVLVFRGVVQLACAAGLWTLRPFGRWLALALSWIAVLAGAAGLAVGLPSVWPAAGLGIPLTPLVATLSGMWLRSVPNLLSIITIVYLHTPRIAALFARGATS